MEINRAGHREDGRGGIFLKHREITISHEVKNTECSTREIEQSGGDSGFYAA